MPDLWDILALVGVACVCAGIGFIHWQSGLIVLGLSLVAIYAVREMSYVSPPSDRKSDRADKSDKSAGGFD